ncbi:MAG: 2,3-bisphosphoglycerate-independent phosphoglycerate mutase [Planctomycetota bacterium]|jgi:2,3-bisphosphoglycerate-independent phosphoglycerate mutase
MAGPLALIILDGFGQGVASKVNAVTVAEPKFYMDLRERYPFTTLTASGEEVGLPCGLMGNSEVGHLNIGAGRIVWQEISRIDKTIRDGSFFTNRALIGAVEHARQRGSTLHLMGLCSDGGVHSSDQHLSALLLLCKQNDLVGDRVQLHAFLDGRDTPPKSALGYIEAVEKEMSKLGVGRIATVSGRYYAMDRDKRWDRTKTAYDALVLGEGLAQPTATAAIEAAYGRGETDEFVMPSVVAGASSIRDDDAVIFYNFRSDRARQLTAAISQEKFDGFERPRLLVHMVSMTRYRQDFDCPVAFEPSYLKGIFPEVVSAAGLTQLRIAETEKYAHVTFFLSGGDEKEYPGEQRILIPSPKVKTYDQQPEMSAVLVTDKLLAVLAETPPDVTILNFANADMVGHTGDLDAAVSAVRTLDDCLSRIVPRYLELGGTVAITADHGNCELMVDPETGEPHTAHTTNPVPFLMVGRDVERKRLKSGGRLCDIATTLLPLLGLPPDPSMEGVSLL